MTRIGEYALLHFGFGYDRSRNNVGIGLSIEPPPGRLRAELDPAQFITRNTVRRRQRLTFND